ncbi:hypothetical protein CERSUDRAFT_99901 [Gelatoporia subvermispora B]|uniref:Uncharacterized protein n=1 Tax=Ceriporiopsis subvermispora (strain B) TaxID=914234 RepID=M2QIL6_CERS8|nr:hypothetical protein CERSUDRAFT_99901 [Gelatoporia subvermispora B]
MVVIKSSHFNFCHRAASTDAASRVSPTRKQTPPGPVDFGTMHRLFSRRRASNTLQKQMIHVIGLDEQSTWEAALYHNQGSPLFDALPSSTGVDTGTNASRRPGGTFLSHLSLIPLSSAQSRADIRRRDEGFEMKQEPPFAVQTQNLISLGEAQAREEIRRRLKVFEAATSQERMEVDASADKPSCNEEANSIGSLTAAFSTPSVYSEEFSWDENARNTTMENSFRELTELRKAYAGNLADTRDFAAEENSQHSDSSFNEESFLRMAASLKLGW